METVIEISCAEVWQEVSSYIDGDVTPELKVRMEQHFEKCRHCQAVLEGTRNSVRLLTDGDWFPLPEGFGERLFHRFSCDNRNDKP